MTQSLRTYTHVFLVFFLLKWMVFMKAALQRLNRLSLTNTVGALIQRVLCGVLKIYIFTFSVFSFRDRVVFHKTLRVF